MEAIYRLFTLRPHLRWAQLDSAQRQIIVEGIQTCWHANGGQLILEHPLAWRNVELTWLAFGIASELNITALQTLLKLIADRGWDLYVECELPIFLHSAQQVDLYYN